MLDGASKNATSLCAGVLHADADADASGGISPSLSLSLFLCLRFRACFRSSSYSLDSVSVTLAFVLDQSTLSLSLGFGICLSRFGSLSPVLDQALALCDRASLLEEKWGGRELRKAHGGAEEGWQGGQCGYGGSAQHRCSKKLRWCHRDTAIIL